MKKYHNFIGIDIGKFKFDVAIYTKSQTYSFNNNQTGIKLFLKQFKELLPNAICCLESTGGYEVKLLETLANKNMHIHRADARKVKNFIRSFGSAVKNDRLDAQAIARYIFERHETLELYQPLSETQKKLKQLVLRRSELKQTLVQEKNRYKSPDNDFVKEYYESIIDVINKQISVIDQKIKEIVKNCDKLSKKIDILQSIPGVGLVTAINLAIILPELGLLSRKKIASLAGLAPRTNESGTYFGYRATGHGKAGVKPILFLAAMAARRSKTRFKEFYEKLIANGKKKMVALTALMRKILVVANARLKLII